MKKGTGYFFLAYCRGVETVFFLAENVVYPLSAQKIIPKED